MSEVIQFPQRQSDHQAEIEIRWNNLSISNEPCDWSAFVHSPPPENAPVGSLSPCFHGKASFVLTS